MRLSRRSLALTLMLPSAFATARDLPAELVQTSRDLFLKGQPRFVRIDAGNWALERKFDKAGVMISQMVGGATNEVSHEVELKNKKLVEIRFTPSNFGNRRRSMPLQFDSNGRVTAIRDANFGGSEDNASPFEIPPSRTELYKTGFSNYVRIIRYEDSRQVQDIYRDRTKVRSISYEFSAADQLVHIQCIAGDCANADEVRLGENGPLQSDNNLLAITYTYENGVPVEETTLTKLTNKASHVYYGDYQFDACGNWIRQAGFDAPASDTTRKPIRLTVRKIEYFTPCK